MPDQTFTAGQILTAQNQTDLQNNIGLTFIKTDTITSGTSKEITGVFSSDFKNYRIIVSNGLSNGTSTLRMRLGTDSSGVYYFSGISVAFGTTTVTGESSAAGTSFSTSAIFATGTSRSSAVIELQMPNQAAFTNFQALGIDARTNGTGARSFSGFVNNNSVYTSFTLLIEGGNTFSSCDVAVYGYRN